MDNILVKIIFRFILKNKINFSLYLICILLTLIISSLVLPIYLSKIFDIKPSNINKTYLSICLLIISFILFYFFKNKFQNNLLVKLSSYSQSEVITLIIKNLNDKLDYLTTSEINIYSNMIYWGLRIVIKYIVENFIPYIFINLILIIYFILTKKFSIFIILIIQFISFTLILKNSFKKQIKNGNNIEIDWVNYSKKLGEKIDNLEHIFFNDTLNFELDKLKENQLYLDNSSIFFYKYNNFTELKLNIVIYLFFIIIIYLIINKKIPGTKKVISILLFILLIYLTNLSNFTKETMFIFHNLSKIVKTNQYLKSISKKNNIFDSVSKSNITFFNIEFKNIYFSYNKDNQKLIFKNLNINIFPHKINLIKGRSGSGKTTLFKLLFKKVNPISGIIKCGPYNLYTLPIKTIFDNVYYVNQKTNLLNLSIFKNINYGNNSNKNEIMRLLNKYDLEDVFQSLDKSNNYLDFIVTNRGDNLSLGMQKVIIILRSILKKNKNILIFDEPLTSLDYKTGLKIIKMILSEKGDKTYVIITHDNNFDQYSQNNIFL